MIGYISLLCRRFASKLFHRIQNKNNLQKCSLRKACHRLSSVLNESIDEMSCCDLLNIPKIYGYLYVKGAKIRMNIDVKKKKKTNIVLGFGRAKRTERRKVSNRVRIAHRRFFSSKIQN